MMQYIRPFSQVEGTVNLVVTATPGTITPTRAHMGTQTVRILNAGTQIVFVSFGEAVVVPASTATSMPILPNSVETFLLRNEVGFLSFVAAGTGSTVYVTTGESA